METKIKQEVRSIGYNVPIPAKPTDYDANDPFYGTLRVKKNNFVGYVASAKAAKTATIVIDRLVFNKKYHRYYKRQTRLTVHNPSSINAKEGDVVKVFETRPLSKTKHHVIVQVLGKHVDIKGQDLTDKESVKDESN